MASLKHRLKVLHRRNSKRHVVLLSFGLLLVFGLSCAARYYAFVPLKIMDSSMTPAFRERSVIWMCKLPNCLNAFTEGEIVLINRPGDEMMIRKILALPGDTIQISDKGQVRTPRDKFIWKNEDSFIQSRSFYVPKAGDTLDFEKLNDVEEDYAIGYLRGEGQRVVVKTSLWQGNHEISMDRVGATKIANRQVSLNEVDFLPWQDRFLIEEQIRQSEPGNAPIKLKRKIFTADDKPIRFIPVHDDCYYLVCNKSSNCPDSREFGYVTSDYLVGSYMELPTQFQNHVVAPVVRKSVTVGRLLSALFNEAFNSVVGLFASSENPEQPLENGK